MLLLFSSAGVSQIDKIPYARDPKEEKAIALSMFEWKVNRSRLFFKPTPPPPPPLPSFSPSFAQCELTDIIQKLCAWAQYTEPLHSFAIEEHAPAYVPLSMWSVLCRCRSRSFLLHWPRYFAFRVSCGEPVRIGCAL